jgi:hypothetical protein
MAQQNADTATAAAAAVVLEMLCGLLKGQWKQLQLPAWTYCPQYVSITALAFCGLC